MFGYIYLLQTRESYNKGESVYKLGRTTRGDLGRFNQYPKGSLLWLHIRCFDELEMEKVLLTAFRERFTQHLPYGNEYFNGNVEEMTNLICMSIGYACHAPTSIVKHERTIHQTQARIAELEASLQIRESELATIKDDMERMKKERPITPLCEPEIKVDDDVNNDNNSEVLLVDSNRADNCSMNVFRISQNKNNKTCSKCLKLFSRKEHMRTHERNCDGFHKLQCKICYKVFKTQQGKWKHSNKVKCEPVSNIPKLYYE